MFDLRVERRCVRPLMVAAAVVALGSSACTWPWTRPDPAPTPPTAPPPTKEIPKEDPKPGDGDEGGDGPITPIPDEREIDPPKPPEPPPKPGALPTASKVPGRPGFVFSPFNNKIIDVKGIPSGTVVSDPQFPREAKKHFIVP